MTGPERPRSLPPEPARPAHRRGPRPDPARRAAYDVLAAVRTTDAYANLVLPRLLRQQRITGRDAAFATELAYGALRAQGALDAILARCVDRPLASLDGGVLDLLRLGGYQLLRTRVGPHAAVSATVDLARIVTTDGPAKLVNAVLRRVSEHDYASWLDLTAPADDPIGTLAVRHAHPRWVAQAFCDALSWPLAGTNRCRLHGGSFPQAQARARERIIAATGYGCRSACATARPGRERCVAVRPTVRARSAVRVTFYSRRLPFGVASRPKMILQRPREEHSECQQR